jgi:hypothetical protein
MFRIFGKRSTPASESDQLKAYAYNDTLRGWQDWQEAKDKHYKHNERERRLLALYACDTCIKAPITR